MSPKPDPMWELHHYDWRDPAQVASHWREAGQVEPRMLQYRSEGRFWETLQKERMVLLLTREYEHMALALAAPGGKPRLSYLRLPHPSGLAVDLKRGLVHLASTRNPNQVFDLAPLQGLEPREDIKGYKAPGRPLIPIAARFFPGSCYFHDLAMVGGELHANAVGQNAVARLAGEGGFQRVWWPKSIERKGGPAFGRNYLQLNSIAAGKDIKSSYFSASSEAIGRFRPGQLNFPVDGKGVIFSGRSREVMARGLTRPHSARIHKGKVWVDNSGYGELGFIQGGSFRRLARLPGWTRGLCFWKGLAIVGSSKVIPKFQRYAPGLNPGESECGLHLVDSASGAVKGSLIWPFGNQIFAIEAMPESFCTGFPFEAGQKKGADKGILELFYAFRTGRGRSARK